MTGKNKIDADFEFLTAACTELKACLEEELELPKGHLEGLRERINESVKQVDAVPGLSEKIAEFEKLCREYARKLHGLYQSRDLARWERYTRKLDLCREVRKLNDCDDSDLPRVARELKLIRMRWKDIGSVPHEKSEELWNEFCVQGDKLQERITEYYNQLEDKRRDIALEKVKICEEAEKLRDSTDWEDTAGKFKVLQKAWREVGFAAPDKEKELYLRFRAACDVFFDARKAYYQQVKVQKDSVSSIKYQLCEEAKTIFDLSYSKAHQLIPDLWKRWKAVGSAGKHDRELYERFRGYFDTYYERLRQQRSENLKIKQGLCEKLEKLSKLLENGKRAFPEIKDDYLKLKQRWDATGAMPRTEEQPVQEKYLSLTGKLDAAGLESPADNRKILERSYKLEQIASAALASLDQNKTSDWEKYRSLWEEEDAAEKSFFSEHFAAINQVFENWSDERCGELLATAARNLKKRQQICRDLESLCGGIETENADLAEELTAAIANNFADEESPPKADPLAEKINLLARRWLKAGIVPLADLPKLYKRFERAMENAQKP
ncbi:MAG: DUF349 domain-containing protein [Victivallales bacterium]|nr:DUF349 domain-containing protein [Victivallales bacterium]